MKTRSENKKNDTPWIYPVALLPLVTGCTPGPPPPAGFIFGPGPGGIWLFFVALIALAAWFFIKTIKTGSSGRNEEITKSLHKIHDRLEELERQIRHIKNSTQRGNHE